MIVSHTRLDRSPGLSEFPTVKRLESGESKWPTRTLIEVRCSRAPARRRTPTVTIAVKSTSTVTPTGSTPGEKYMSLSVRPKEAKELAKPRSYASRRDDIDMLS